jgi:hypothetical protein
MKAVLFLGTPLVGELSLLLAIATPSLKAHFIKDDPSYLQIISHEGQEYIGKFTDPTTTLAQIDQLEINIQTLLTKLLPGYDHPDGSFFLLPTAQH